MSTFHAIAKQTIGGLSQGLELKAPIIFEGGPLTFNSTLIRVFAERLGLSDKDYIVPQHAETIVAYGTAVAIDNLFDDDTYVTIDELINRIDISIAPAIIKAFDAFSIKYSSFEFLIFIF